MIKNAFLMGFFIFSLVLSQVSQSSQNIVSQENKGTINQEELTCLCVKFYMLISCLPELDQAMKDAQAKKQELEVTMRVRGIKIEVINQIIQKIMDGLVNNKDAKTVAADVSSQITANNVKEFVGQLTNLLAETYELMVQAAAFQEALQELNQELESVKTSLMNQGYSEEGAIDFIQKNMQEVEKNIEAHLAEIAPAANQ
jgi:hypothetical protein